jgi:deoxycytidine triphosphate deaminase
MIWNDKMLTAWATAGGVTPFDSECVNPASLDLRLGNMIREPLRCWRTIPKHEAIDKTTSASQLWTEAFAFTEYTIRPGQCVLCHSMEYIKMPRYAVGMLASKSSTGRMLLEHFHSGFFDCSFMGTATFEFKNDGPWQITLRPGDRWVQLVMMQMAAEPERDYSVTGRYQGQILPEAHR